jgi:ELWxxDGT repeat protein
MASSRFMLFDGPNSDLWVSDGTAAGTVDLGAISNASSSGLNPQFLTEFNNQILFEGTDSNNEFGLWVTNGTAAGTHELTGISGANPSGLGPGYLAVFGNEVLFRGEAGVAGDDVPGLWITNGTAAGTFELGGVANIGIPNISPGGMLPIDPDFTVLNGVVLFSARDAANNQGLWVSDGTVANTFELAPIPGAFAVGTPGSDVLGSGPNMAVLGNVVLFTGTDLQDTPGSLWETNGTAAGTFEIGGQGNAGIVGSPNGFTGQFTSELPLGIQPNDLTTLNGQVLFAGFDNTTGPNGYYTDTDALWVSDGTAAGTVEVGGAGNAGIAGANPAQSGGIFWYGSIEFPDFTVYNGMALFVGYDSSGQVSLWETDGTAIGTTEIGGLGNAGIANISFSGLVSDSESPQFTVFDGKVYFQGTDAAGKTGLWETDGTAAGTQEVLATGNGSPIDLTAYLQVLDITGTGNHAAFTFTTPSTSFAIDSDNANGATLTGTGSLPNYQVDGVEFLNFTDKTVFVENPNNADIARLYSAAFDRAPDIAGLSFWEDVYTNSVSAAAKSQGYYTALAETAVGSENSIADGFIASSEFQSRYGTLTNTGFVTAMYENVLGRAPDQAGLNFWLGELAGGETRAIVLVGFAESPENIAKTAAWLVTT